MYDHKLPANVIFIYIYPIHKLVLHLYTWLTTNIDLH